MLGACLISASAIEKVQAILDPSDFYRESHGVIFETMRRMNVLGEPVDAVTVVAELERAGQLQAVGGKVRLHEIARLVPTSANAAHYARIVSEHATRRGLIATANEIAVLGWEMDGETAEAQLGRAELLLEELRQRRASTEQDEIITLHQAAQYLDEKFRNPPDETAWIPCPWPSLHVRMGPGRMYVLGGYAKDGKTSGGLQWFQAAASAGISVTFLSLEMAKWDVAERLAAIMGLPARTVTSGKLGEEMRPLARKVLSEMTAIAPNARIWDAPAADIPAIRAHVKAVRPSLLIIDHLHEFHLRAEYERQDLEAIVRGLWRIAREFNITILLLAQLSRSGDKRHPFPMPSMSSLKGSGAIEQLAWAVWFIYRERDENNLATEDSLFVVAANRSGGVGTRRLHFNPRTVSFTAVQREEAA